MKASCEYFTEPALRHNSDIDEEIPAEDAPTGTTHLAVDASPPLSHDDEELCSGGRNGDSESD